MSESGLKQIFVHVERHVMPLIGGDSPQGLSKEENRILALQNIARLNQRIGFLARQGSREMGEMRMLQTYVNNLTIGVKTDNVQLMKNALTSTRSLVETLEPSSGQSK